tara:strand:- start:18861 stop:19724 length:864 start_codon:yes stop_codon:yes gene_type:complete
MFSAPAERFHRAEYSAADWSMSAESTPNTTVPGRRLATGKLIASGVLVFHLVALVGPPLSLQTQGPLGSSPSVAMLMQPVRWYCQSFYLDRGYAFFAPDPGPSHLIQAATTQSDGSRVEQMYPDLQQQWPRLLYHRYFMLAEFLTEIHQPPGPPAELFEAQREEAEAWVRSRARYEHVRQSMIEHLKHSNGNDNVAIRRIEHLIPDFISLSVDDVALTDEDLYRVLLDRPIISDIARGPVPGRTQELPVAVPETIPPPVAEQEQSAAGHPFSDKNEDEPLSPSEAVR